MDVEFNVQKLKAVTFGLHVSLCLHYFVLICRPEVKLGHDTSQLGVIRRRNLLSAFQNGCGTAARFES